MSEIEPITRWEPVIGYVSGDHFARMEIDEDGDYVDYDDHLAALAQARAEERERCMAAIRAIDKTPIDFTRGDALAAIRALSDEPEGR